MDESIKEHIDGVLEHKRQVAKYMEVKERFGIVSLVPVQNI